MKARKGSAVRLPYLLMGPDIHGPALYSRHRTYAAALRKWRWMGGPRSKPPEISIVKVILQGTELNSEQRAMFREERQRRAADHPPAEAPPLLPARPRGK